MINETVLVKSYHGVSQASISLFLPGLYKIGPYNRITP